jgi:inner membrane protein
MDNVTHALAGLLAADVLVGATTPRGATPDPDFRRRAWLVSALTNNLPDFDFLYRAITAGRVGYLLHHRGHTHTFVVGLVLGLSTFAVVASLERRRSRREPWADGKTGERARRRERHALLALSVGGPAIHIGMDFFNNYGIHPFWPVDNGWVYGDSIFIIEPWFAVFTIPPLYFACRTIGAKLLLASILVLVVVLAWLLPLASATTAMLLMLGAAGWFWWCSRARAERRAFQSLLGSLLVLLLFVGAGRAARARVLESQTGSGALRLDAVLTPAPANPLCWSAITIAQRAQRYELKLATLSLWPELVGPDGCRFEPSGKSLLEGGARSSGRFGELSNQAVVGKTPPGLRWDLAWSAPVSELKSLFRANCQAAAYLRYSRVPFWFPAQPEGVFLGDLRYDRRPDLEFAELEVSARPENCPRFVPPWRPPRHDLLETQ